MRGKESGILLMKWHEQHEAFKQFAIQQGISRLEEFVAALPFGYEISSARLDRWFKEVLAIPTVFSSQRRYVNRFKLGADPEFIFQVPSGNRYDARLLGLQQGLAFGMDNNGRLTEIRPHPSRSALEVVASILTTLRWLAVIFPNTVDFHWVSGVFLHGDGIGGHVHFGRKRPSRGSEIAALDTISNELVNVGCYSLADILLRRAGDQHNQHYGMPGDFRHQMHGYEYRTFPSWLDSPQLAFLILTLSKLAVHNPKLFQGYPVLVPHRYNQRVRNLLSYYKDTDDDARLALSLIAKGFPRHLGGDFKTRWGISKVSGPKIEFIPMCFAPTKAEIDEVFAYLRGQAPLGMKIPVVNWGPPRPPSGYDMVINQTNTYGAKGLGELVWDIVQYTQEQYQFVNERGMHLDEGGQYLSIPKKLADRLPQGWRKMTAQKIRVHGEGNMIYSNDKAREPHLFVDCRRLLLETVLPFWKITDVKPDSYAQWRMHTHAVKVPKFSGTLVHGDPEKFPIKGLQ